MHQRAAAGTVTGPADRDVFGLLCVLPARRGDSTPGAALYTEVIG
jgi:hypothetical protein